jgi:hypothetical protein
VKDNWARIPSKYDDYDVIISAGVVDLGKWKIMPQILVQTHPKIHC